MAWAIRVKVTLRVKMRRKGNRWVYRGFREPRVDGAEDMDDDCRLWPPPLLCEGRTDMSTDMLALREERGW
jgi:hypothetical protein